MRDLLAELSEALDKGRECVWCAVIETRGSTPQKAGAAMVVFPDGGQSGTLGGGCVEAEVRQRALRGLGSGQAEVHVFNLDDNYGWDDGLICGGRMTILAAPLDRAAGPAAEYYRRFHALVESGKGCTEAVLVAGTPSLIGQRFLFDAAGSLVARIGAGDVPSQVHANLPNLAERPRPLLRDGVAYLPFLPRITLLIVGGGHVGQAVARLAADVDFDIWILDDRERYASSERFPMARRRLIGDIGAELKQLRDAIDPSFFCIIVTRGHSHDEEALYHLAATHAGYVGMIGSKRKKKLIYEDLLAKGITQDMLDRVHSPLGFDIGSQTVNEIAVSIVAELIACRNKRS